MGDFTLGCLLGQYDRAQSFDVASSALPTQVGSWETNAGSLTYNNNASVVHSSAQSIEFRVGSRGAANLALQYFYGYPNDLIGRWFPDVTTHNIQTDFWANAFGTSSGAFSHDYAGAQSLKIAANAAFAHYRNGGVFVSSFTISTMRFMRSGSLTDPDVRLYVDDVLNQVDFITLHPEFEFQAAERAIRSQHRTLGGRLHTYTWDKYGAWNMPLRYLPTSHADLLNWWWQQGLNLAFTLDTSDSESIHICRIVNERQPIGGRERPYADLWQGTLQLEAINRGNLDF